MRFMIGLAALAALTACGGNKGNNAGAANAANGANAANAAAPANTATPAANVADGAASAQPRPVLTGVDAEIDPCPSTARSIPARNVVVRAAPDASAPEVGRLDGPAAIAICDQDDRTNPQAEWYGVIYAADTDALRACGIPDTSAGNGGAPYTGTCRSGWVRASDVEVVAG